VKRDVEDGADAIPAFVRELHRMGSMVSHIGIVNNGYSAGVIGSLPTVSALRSLSGTLGSPSPT
jgi:hypothetical protein